MTLVKEKIKVKCLYVRDKCIAAVLLLILIMLLTGCYAIQGILSSYVIIKTLVKRVFFGHISFHLITHFFLLLLLWDRMYIQNVRCTHEYVGGWIIVMWTRMSHCPEMDRCLSSDLLHGPNSLLPEVWLLTWNYFLVFLVVLPLAIHPYVD